MDFFILNEKLDLAKLMSFCDEIDKLDEWEECTGSRSESFLDEVSSWRFSTSSYIYNILTDKLMKFTLDKWAGNYLNCQA